ncbi:signal peptidase I [bacterium]|nr:signal peptidase I [candidate division CSSED10-310 bacterium]
MEQKKPNRVKQEIKEWSRSLLWGAIFVYFFTGYVFKAYKVEGKSMQPLLQNGERIFVNRLIYRVDDIKRGDIIVFYHPAEPKDFFIKRVLGLPGETVEVRRGKVMINGKPIDDHFVPDYFKSRETVPRMIIPIGHYFVSGDHRNQSYDSRSWAMDPERSAFVPEQYIMGRASFRYWPLSSFGIIESDYKRLEL